MRIDACVIESACSLLWEVPVDPFEPLGLTGIKYSDARAQAKQVDTRLCCLENPSQGFVKLPGPVRQRFDVHVQQSTFQDICHEQSSSWGIPEQSFAQFCVHTSQLDAWEFHGLFFRPVWVMVMLGFHAEGGHCKLQTGSCKRPEIPPLMSMQAPCRNRTSVDDSANAMAAISFGVAILF